MLRKKATSGTETHAKVNTLIGEGTIFDGNLTASDTIRIDGTVNGNCSCDQTLIVGASGHIIGNVISQNVILSGRVEGDILTNGKLEFLPTGKLVGNINTNILVVDEGAYFDGRCTMSSDTPSNNSYINDDQQE